MDFLSLDHNRRIKLRIKLMKTNIILPAVLSILVLSVVCGAQAANYQNGKIVSVHQLKADAQAAQQPQARSESTDAPLKNDVKKYEIVVETGGTSYTCHYLAPSDLDPGWANGKSVQVRVEGNVVHIKNANGKDEKLSIVSSKPVSG